MKKVIFVLAIIMFMVMSNEEVENIIIPTSSIRVRIIASSSDKEDIKVKENVKSDLEPYIYSLLKDVNSIEEARTILEKNLPNIDVEVQKSLNRQNKNDTFKTVYGLNYFPEKEYKGLKYEDGYYESLVIKIGEGLGENWWCVLFPPLCMLDLEENLDDVEYRSFAYDLINKYI